MITNEMRKRAIKVSIILSALLPGMTLLPQAHADSGGTYSVYDTDRDGYLDRVEFEKFAESRRKRAGAAGAWEFATIDTDSDGKISEQEMVDGLIKDMQRRRQAR